MSAVAGPLADEASARDREIREILQANLAHLLGCRAGTRVERQDNRKLLVVEAAYRYATRDISALGALIQDVAWLREQHLAHIGQSAGARGFDAAPKDGAIFFRP